VVERIEGGVVCAVDIVRGSGHARGACGRRLGLGTLAERQSLVRLREKLRRAAAADLEVEYTQDDLIQVQYVLAQREIDAALRSDLDDSHRLIETHLGVPYQAVALSSEKVRAPISQPVLRVIGGQLAEHDTVEFGGANASHPPRWDRFELGEDLELVPGWISIYWDADTVCPVPLVLSTYDHQGHQHLDVYSRVSDQPVGKAYLDGLIAAAKGPKSPYRGRLLKASWAQTGGVQFNVLPNPTETRAALVFARASGRRWISMCTACSSGWRFSTRRGWGRIGVCCWPVPPGLVRPPRARRWRGRCSAMSPWCMWTRKGGRA
jgi:hypothetical protein